MLSLSKAVTDINVMGSILGGIVELVFYSVATTPPKRGRLVVDTMVLKIPLLARCCCVMRLPHFATRWQRFPMQVFPQEVFDITQQALGNTLIRQTVKNNCQSSTVSPSVRRS